MQQPWVPAALRTAISCATELGLPTGEALVLQEANRLAVRLLPCDVLVRIARVAGRWGGDLELEAVSVLAGTGAPVAGLDPRVPPGVYERDGLVLTFWSYYEPAGSEPLPPAEYARALGQLHAAFRTVDLPVPHFTDRVAEAQAIVDEPGKSPALAPGDRELLSGALKTLTHDILARGAPQQLLHGEPHPGNLLSARDGPRFIDFETCCRGPVEFDVAGAPEDVADHYPGLDIEMLGWCRALTVALVAAWRWDRDDYFPNGREMGIEFTGRLREMMGA